MSVACDPRGLRYKGFLPSGRRSRRQTSASLKARTGIVRRSESVTPWAAHTSREISSSVSAPGTNSRTEQWLANEAGRTPKDILKHVLRDGFDATEYAIKAVRARMQSVERVSHEDAMQQLDNLTERHARDEKQAA